MAKYLDEKAKNSPYWEDGNFTMNTPLGLKGYTVATLPTGTQGEIAFVTDALAPTFLTAIVGGGAVVTVAI